jgi:tetratricopeptide (TPR) repeat protein
MLPLAWLVPLLLIGTACAAEPPRASGQLEQARRHFERGRALFNQGQYAAAREAFAASYRLSGMTDLLYNLARVSEKMDDLEAALRYYERYLKARPDAPDRRQIEQEMERLGNALAIQNEPPPAPLVLPPEPPRRRPAWLPPWPQVALMSGGAAFLILGIGLGSGALATARAIEGRTIFDPDLDQRGRGLEAAAITFDVLGVAALGAGAAWTAVWAVRLSSAMR